MHPKNGTLSIDGDTTEVRFERHLSATLDDVWSAIATSDGVTRWLVREADMAESVGGAIRLVFGDDAVVGGTITTRESGRALAHGWDYGPEARSDVAWSLTPADDGIVLGLVHRGLPEEQARGYLPGWHAYLDRLASVLAEEEPGDWESMYATAAAIYAEG